MDGLKPKVVGHTDNTGPASVNQRISVQRAEAVANYLVAQGLSADRIATEKKGEAEPAVPNSSAQHRALNRRIEFIMYSP